MSSDLKTNLLIKIKKENRMPTLNEISFQIKDKKAEVSNENRFSEIIDIFIKDIDKKFSSAQIAENDFLISDILNSFYNLKKYEKGINFIDNYLKIDLRNINNSFIINLYGKCLYNYLKIKNNKNSFGEEEYSSNETEDFIDEAIIGDIDSLYNKTKLLLQILDIKDKYHYVTVKELCFNFVKLIVSAKTHWDYALEIIDSINPEDLSKEPYMGTIKGKQKELASHYETWFAQRSKILFEMGNYAECLSFSQKLLSDKILNHHDYDIWCVRRIALCYSQMKEYNLAIEGLLKSVKSKKVWFLQKELAENYFLIGDYKSSLKYALDAALGSGELKFKWELFYLIYETLEKLGNHEYSLISLKLAAAIRINEKWKLREKLTQSLAKYNIALDNLNVNTLKNKLDELAYSQLNKGIIKDYNAEKRFGFIEFNDSRIFFRASSYKGNASQLKVGERVIFAEDTDYDPVKKKESLAAYFVKRIN